MMKAPAPPTPADVVEQLKKDLPGIKDIYVIYADAQGNTKTLTSIFDIKEVVGWLHFAMTLADERTKSIIRQHTTPIEVPSVTIDDTTRMN
jgi:hypothetical protein